MIPTELRQDIIAKAKRLPQEPWFAGTPFTGNRGSEVGGAQSFNRICADMGSKESEYIAMLDPCTVMALLTYIEKLEEIIGLLGDERNARGKGDSNTC